MGKRVIVESVCSIVSIHRGMVIMKTLLCLKYYRKEYCAVVGFHKLWLHMKVGINQLRLTSP